jgi:hypothetical protein
MHAFWGTIIAFRGAASGCITCGKRTLFLVQSKTVVRWHRAGFRLYWTGPVMQGTAADTLTAIHLATRSHTGTRRDRVAAIGSPTRLLAEMVYQQGNF